MKWLSSTALSTCHKTGFLNPHALRNMLTAITRAYFEVVVRPTLVLLNRKAEVGGSSPPTTKDGDAR